MTYKHVFLEILKWMLQNLWKISKYMFPGYYMFLTFFFLFRPPHYSIDDLDLGPDLFIGGTDPATTRELSWHLWTSNPKFFMGCIWGLVINGGNPINLPKYAREQNPISIHPGCDEDTLECPSRPCMHGECVSQGDQPFFKCDGADTDYTGSRCHQGKLFFLATKKV